MGPGWTVACGLSLPRGPDDTKRGEVQRRPEYEEVAEKEWDQSSLSSLLPKDSRPQVECLTPRPSLRTGQN